MPISKKGPLPRLARGRFKLEDRLGSGAFGEVFAAIDTTTGREVAAKVEIVSAKKRQQQLAGEAKTLKALWRWGTPQGFAEFIHFGEEPPYRCLIMERLGKNLEGRLQLSGGQFCTRTTVLVAEQVLQCIEYFHSKGFVHRDIKPENFVLGLGPKQHHLHLIDFGLCKVYYARRHMEMGEGALAGTVRFASINAQSRVEQSRRDDLEAVAHMLIYFLRGSLPWCGLAATNTEDKNELMLKIKMETPISEFCSNYPEEFGDFLGYCRGLGFTDRPDYAAWKERFQLLRAHLAEDLGHSIEDHDFKWNDGQDLGPLEPLRCPGQVLQPDERGLHAHLRNLRQGLLCGRMDVDDPSALAGAVG